MKLFELGRPITAIDKKQAMEWIQKNAQEFVRNKQPIFRGDWFRGDGDALIWDTDASVRVSKNTKNYYTLFMDNEPMWSVYPKRSKSLICTTSPNDARGYGHARMIFPSDSCKIGMCPEYDLWKSFPRLLNFMNMMRENRVASMMNANNILASMIAIFADPAYDVEDDQEEDFDAKDIYQTSWPALRGVLQDISVDAIRDVLREKSDTWPSGKLRAYNLLARRMEKKMHENLYEYLQDVLDPKANGFSLHTPGNFPGGIRRELWIGGGDVLVVEETREFLELLEVSSDDIIRRKLGVEDESPENRKYL